MMLDRADFNELLSLLRVAMSGALTSSSERRLRFLLAREDAEAAVLRIPDLIRLGQLIGGIYALSHGIYPATRPQAPAPA